MKLSAIKKQLASVNPFLIYTFAGVNGCLLRTDEEVENSPAIPLSVSVTPPSISFIIGTSQITSLILRYSETYRKQVESQKEGQRLEMLPSDVANNIVREMTAKVLASDEEKAKQVGLMVELGKEFLMQKAIFGWYGDEQDKFDIRFTTDKMFADTENNKGDDTKLFVWTESLSDLELINIGMELIQAIPKDQIPNIPIGDVKVKDGEILPEGVISSVPADKLASFPRNLRDIPVENVPQQGR